MEEVNMDIRALVIASNACYIMSSKTGGYTQPDTASAKDAAAQFVSNPSNKPTVGNGYDAVVLDLDSHKVLSWASQPKPSITWTDSPTT